MIQPSQVVSIHPYFKVKPGKMAEAKAFMSEFIRITSAEPGNLYYHFTLSDDLVFCREAYVGAEGLLKHVEGVGATLAEFMKIADVVRVEIHGSAGEIEKLKGPMIGLKPQWFEFQCGVEK